VGEIFVRKHYKYTFFDPCQEKCSHKICLNILIFFKNIYISDQYEYILWIYVNDIEESHV